MPYIPEKSRKEIDIYLAPLMEKMKEVRKEEDLILMLLHDICLVSTHIYNARERQKYYEAFAGELNYALHTIMLEFLPEMRYWAMALTTGWITRIAEFFREVPLENVLEEHEKKRDRIPFGSKRAIKHVVEWVSVRIARLSAPDCSQDARDCISGVFEHLNAEYSRRLLGPYEDMQIRKNDDLAQYKKLRAKFFSASA